jgi:hypothetical protein
MTYIDAHMKDALKDHVLIPLDAGKDMKAFYLKKPGEGRMMSTLIVFTPEGIVIQGDLTPGQNGNVSCFNYGLDWFRGDLSEGYLCGKFLETSFSREGTDENIREAIISKRREGGIDRDAARELWDERPQDEEMDERGFYDFFCDRLGDDASESIRYDYRPGEAGWLCVIQQRFAALYNAAQATA